MPELSNFAIGLIGVGLLIVMVFLGVRVFVAAALMTAPVLARADSDRPAVIFDTDMGNDVDDALALAMIHALQSRGECELLAVTITNALNDPPADEILIAHNTKVTPFTSHRHRVVYRKRIAIVVLQKPL